jgi:predicted metal-dependent phosphoesterase TrpH
MLIDMHNHTNICSPCSVLYPEELIEQAKIMGLDGICVTDHHDIDGAEVTKEIGLKMNFPVFRGIEASTELGDMLVFGYYRPIPANMPLLELLKMVHGEGGIVFAAHPFHTNGGWSLYLALKKRGVDLDHQWRRVQLLDQLDGFEVINGNIPHKLNTKAARLSFLMKKVGIGGSDAHLPKDIARAATRFHEAINTDQQLVDALKHGRCEAVYL